MDEFDLDPDEVRRLGYRAADLVADHRAGLAASGRSSARWATRRRSSTSRCPRRARPADGGARRRARPGPRRTPSATRTRASSPSSTRPPTPLGTVADYLASAMNSNCWGGDHAAIHVERRVVALARRDPRPARDAPRASSPRGGSMANFTALATARRAVAPSVRERRLRGHAAARRLRLRRGPQLRRQGRRPARHRLEAAPQDPDRRRASACAWTCCEQAIAADRKAGLQPAIVVGNAGTVNTGAIDPLDELADLCAREGLWFHVDGAYGAHGRDLAEACGRSSAASSAPTPSPPTRTSGSTCRTRRAPPSCASRAGMADAFRRPAPYLVHDPRQPGRRARSSSTSAGPSCRAASRPSRCGWA